jgi:hypothetical protein
MHLLHSSKYQFFAVLCVVVALFFIVFCVVRHFKLRYLLAVIGGALACLFLLTGWLDSDSWR